MKTIMLTVLSHYKMMPMASYGTICFLTHHQGVFKVMTDSDFQTTPKWDLLYVLQRKLLLDQ